MDQRLSKGMNGDPLLTLTVDIIGELNDRFDMSFGLKPVTDSTPKKARIFLDFGAQKLSKTLEYLECIGITGVKASNFHSGVKGSVSLVGREVKVWDSTNPDTGKTTFRIDKNQGGSVSTPNPAKELSPEEVLAFDTENADLYASANEKPNF